MNFQTPKARARYVGYGLWQVTHPYSAQSVTAHRPHDLAIYLMKNFVLRDQVAARETNHGR